MKPILIATLTIFLVGCNTEAPKPTSNQALFDTPKVAAELAAGDALAHKSMATACEARDFGAFLKDFTNFQRIRAAYSARDIVYERDGKTLKVPAIDNYYYPLEYKRDVLVSSSGFPVTFKAETISPQETHVKWEHLPLDPTASFSEGERQAAREKGTLKFIWVKECWRLHYDQRFSGT